VTLQVGERGNSIRVLLADCNQTQSQLLSSALRRQRGMKVTCCHGELADCLHAMGSAPVDVVLLGVRFTDHDRLLETLRVLHTTHPRVNLILLLDSYDRALVTSAMRAGARGLFYSLTGRYAGVFQLSMRASSGPTPSSWVT